MLDGALGVAGAPATKVHVTDSEPLLAVTVTFAPGMRFLTSITGDESFVMPSDVDAPLSDDAFNATVGGPITVHESVPVEEFPATSVAVYTSSWEPAVSPEYELHGAWAPPLSEHV